jgi:hypothetical protein
MSFPPSWSVTRPLHLLCDIYIFMHVSMPWWNYLLLSFGLWSYEDYHHYFFYYYLCHLSPKAKSFASKWTYTFMSWNKWNMALLITMLINKSLMPMRQSRLCRTSRHARPQKRHSLLPLVLFFYSLTCFHCLAFMARVMFSSSAVFLAIICVSTGCKLHFQTMPEPLDLAMIDVQ